MIFAALVLLSMYLPIRATLQRATQLAATAVASEMSDTWLSYNEHTLTYGRFVSRSQLGNVYGNLFGINTPNYSGKARAIAERAIENSIGPRFGTVYVQCDIVNYVVYREVAVTAQRSIPVGSVVDLSFIGFPAEIEIVVTSSAVVTDGDWFIRNVDLAVDFYDRITGIFSSLTDFIGRFGTGW
jgi:hypothetical protein